jgi:anti-anti-sigma regulatory factor
MDIRIDFISDKSETVVRIAGRLSGSAIEQLKKVCDPIEDPFVIDLSNLLFADDKGIDAIRAIADKGAQVQGASPFVQLLLDNAPGWKTGGEELKPS